jgi:hypothetical protein
MKYSRVFAFAMTLCAQNGFGGASGQTSTGISQWAAIVHQLAIQARTDALERFYQLGNSREYRPE